MEKGRSKMHEMKWFGQPWGAPMFEFCERVLTPVGEQCSRCEEPVGVGDSGVIMLHIEQDGARMRPQHRECFLRGLFGSVAHQMGVCGCPHHGREMTEAEIEFARSLESGLTRREAAKVAERWYCEFGGFVPKGTDSG